MLSFAVVCEAPADREIATALADRVLLAKLTWLTDVLEHMRQWRGYLPEDRQLLWREVPRPEGSQNNWQPEIPNPRWPPAGRSAWILFILADAVRPGYRIGVDCRWTEMKPERLGWADHGTQLKAKALRMSA